MSSAPRHPTSPFYKIAVDRLIEARIAKSWSQYDLAKVWRRHQSIVAKVETYQRNLELIEFLTLCTLLDIDPVPLVAQIHKQIKLDQSVLPAATATPKGNVHLK